MQTRILCGALVCAGLWSGLTWADERERASAREHRGDTQTRTISPARGIRRQALDLPETHEPLRRLFSSDYADGQSELAGPHRPSAREISNHVFAQNESVVNPIGATDYLWQWGQFIDHDIDLTDGVSPPENFPISVPPGDEFFDPHGIGSAAIDFNRSVYVVDEHGVRQQINEITFRIDASMVYGSDEERADALRTLDGTGRLKTSDNGLLPFNEAGLPNAGGESADLFLAGDVRANEQVGLTAMHTLFVREHNRWARRYARRSPGLSGDQIYYRAKRMVTAEIQHITFNEFLPTLLGKRAIPEYRGWRSKADGRVSNAFSTASFRLGHSMLSSHLLQLDKNLQPVGDGALPLRDAFFDASILQAQGIEPILRGLSQQVCQDIDTLVIDDVRNFLFGPPGAGGFDLVSLNIQRGRDHGLPSYVSARAQLGLPPIHDFADITKDVEVQEKLQAAYASVEDIDLWVGALAEDAKRGSLLGRLNHKIVKRQFLALRKSDPYWYERILSKRDLRKVQRTTLADIIRRNTSIGRELPDNVFLLQSAR